MQKHYNISTTENFTSQILLYRVAQNQMKKKQKGNRIKTLTVELVGVVVTVANAIATLARVDAPVVAAPLATRVASYGSACKLIRR